MKTLVFTKDVTSVHGNFMPGDIGKNIPDARGAAMIAAGHAEETSGEPNGDHAQEVRGKAGKITTSETGHVASSSAPFNATDVAAQEAAGVISKQPATPPAGAPPAGFVGTASTGGGTPAPVHDVAAQGTPGMTATKVK